MNKVIDVSYHNGTIDWEKVKAAGYHAILRAGYGMDEPGQDDTQFARNVSECERLGIPWGAYLYSYADNANRVMSEARHMVRLMEPWKDAPNRLYPVFFDSEESGTEQFASQGAVLWCSQLEKEGYRTGVYASESWWDSNLRHFSGNRCRWVARWGSRAPSVAWDIWQYTDRGAVPGCTGNKGRTDVSQSKLDISASTPSPAPTDVNALADAVMRGEYGNGEERKRALSEVYDVVQVIVNLRSGSQAGVSALADAVIRGDYGNGEERKRALGDAYTAVQKVVNKKLSKK